MAELNADGYFDLRFSQDKIQVLVDVYPPQGGGRNANVDEIIAALQRRGVAYGFQIDAIEQAVKHVALNATPAIGILAAQGQHPVHGTDAQVTWKIDPLKASEPLPVRPDGLPDYFAYDPARRVVAGQELAAVIPGLPGTPGKTLVAPFDSVPQAPGRECPVLAGPGVRITANRQQYIAEADGFVALHNDRLSVHALSWIEGDVAGGDHSFSGGLVILGDVCGASLHARGCIAVRGMVRDSNLRGAAKIILTDAENSQIVADGDVHVSGRAVGCQIITPAAILGGPGSALVGGSLIAGNAIAAFDLGADSWQTTDAILGGDVYANIRLREIEEEIEAAETNVKRITLALKPLTSITSEPLTPAKKQLVQTLMDQRRSIEQHIKNLHSERRSRQMMHAATGGSVRVSGRVYPGVRLDLYRSRLDVEQCASDVEYLQEAGGRGVICRPVTAKAA